jgi:hypothetical protein
MKHKKAVRNVTLGLATGLVPLAGAGVTAAAAGEAPSSALCQSWFGERGPVGGPTLGEGPPGDPMTVTVGWETSTWPDGLREVVTCVGIDGHLVPDLTRSILTPRNTGNLIVDLLLPQAPPGSLVCQQSVLIGKGKAEGREHSTSPACFKLRAAEELAAGSGAVGEPTPPASKAPAQIPTVTAGPRMPSAGVASPAPKALPAPTSTSTPPARAAFEAARGAARSPSAWAAPLRSAPAEAPTLPVAAKAAPAATELARTPPANSGALAAPANPRANVARAGAAAVGATGVPGSGAITARAALPHTGLGDKIPLAAAGGLMALGGAAIILGEPRRRRAPVPRFA